MRVRNSRNLTQETVPRHISEHKVVDIRLTLRQRDILNFLRRSYLQIGVPPTVREIMEEFDMHSPNAVMTHLRSLLRKGYIRQIGDGKSRGSLPVVPEGCCPCCGRAFNEA